MGNLNATKLASSVWRCPACGLIRGCQWRWIVLADCWPLPGAAASAATATGRATASASAAITAAIEHTYRHRDWHSSLRS